MSRVRAAAAVVAALMVVLLVAGCGDDRQESGPDGLPVDFPMPDSATPRFSMAGAGDLAGGVQVELTVGRPAGEMRAWYVEQLPTAGYEVHDRDGALEVRGHGRVGVVTVTPAGDDEAVIRVVLEPG